MALLLTEPALGHVDVQPRLVELGTATEVRVELPRLRAGAAPVRLEVEGDGVTVLSSALRRVVAGETRWSVRLLVNASVAPGEVPLVLRAFFSDGESVEVDGSIVAVPPAADPGTAGAFPWVGVAAGVTLAVAFSAGVLLLARRRGRT